ncbi:MATE family efflux transporter [Romboutsia sp.]|uniref:MATE family efflux transporter n=1 Tax=Romboutsia sp. TaxID=1965302 RepID=UPI003F2DAF38
MNKIFKLSWPVMAGMILQSLLATVDMIFVGRLGTSQLAGVGIATSALTVIFVLSTLVSSGVIALVSRYFGEGNLEEVKKISGQAYIMSLVIGSICSILCCIYAKQVLKVLFNPDLTTLKYAYEFSVIVFSGTVLVFVSSTMRTIIQALGDTKTPLYIFGLANILNIILDLILIYKCDLGVRGAAIATLTSTIFSFILINIIVIKKLYEGKISIFVKSLKISTNISRRILKIGSWACIKELARPFTGMLMVSLVYYVGKEAGSAAFSAGQQVLNYTFIFLNGLSISISILVGQNIGSNNIDECYKIVKSGLKLAIINMAVFAIPYFIFPGEIMAIFTNDAEVISTGISYLRIVYVGVIFVVFSIILGGVFQGSGDTLPPMISSIVANVVLKLPLAYLFAINLNMGTNGVWLAVSLSVIIEAAMIIYYFKKDKWKEKVI